MAAAGANRNVNILIDTCASGLHWIETHLSHVSDPTEAASDADGVMYTQAKSACTPTQCAPETVKSWYNNGRQFFILWGSLKAEVLAKLVLTPA